MRWTWIGAACHAHAKICCPVHPNGSSKDKPSTLKCGFVSRISRSSQHAVYVLTYTYTSFKHPEEASILCIFHIQLFSQNRATATPSPSELLSRWMGNMNRTLAVLVGARISLGLFVVGVVVLSLWTSLGNRSRTPPVLYWSIHIDANSTLDLSKRWKGSSDFDPAKRSGIVMKDEYHVTLLYIGNSTDAEIASHNPKFSSASQVAKLRHELEQRKGEWVRVDVSNFVWEDRNKKSA